MSKKREAAESSSNEQLSEGSDPAFQQENNAKRAKVASLSDTTLQDLPFEMVECILVKAVAMEVKSMKLVKSVWKEKADLVIKRLQTVCSQWKSILTTNFFRNEVHRILDGTAQETIHLEILHQFPVQNVAFEMATMKDEIFMLCSPNDQDHIINVYEHNNMVEVKDVIPLPGIQHPWDMAACSVSNCLYLLNKESNYLSVLRITKDEEHSFNISTWIADLKLSLPTLSVSTNGSLIIVSRPQEPNLRAVSIYNVNGSLQQTVMLSSDIYDFKSLGSVMQKPNGNLVIPFYSGAQIETRLTEIDMRGNIVRQYKSGHKLGETDVTVVDMYGRMVITNWRKQIEILDSELNLIALVDPQLHNNEVVYFPSELHYNSDRNELMRMSHFASDKNYYLTIFRFTEK